MVSNNSNTLLLKEAIIKLDLW